MLVEAMAAGVPIVATAAARSRRSSATARRCSSRPATTRPSPTRVGRVLDDAATRRRWATAGRARARDVLVGALGRAPRRPCTTRCWRGAGDRPGRLYAVRHGRTAGNRVRYVGWGDEPLDEIGRAQARELAAAGGRADRRRLREPAEPRGRHGPPASPARVGAEIRSGRRSRRSTTAPTRTCPRPSASCGCERNHRTERMPGGESLRDVLDRVAGVRRRSWRSCARVAASPSSRTTGACGCSSAGSPG